MVLFFNLGKYMLTMATVSETDQRHSKISEERLKINKFKNESMYRKKQNLFSLKKHSEVTVLFLPSIFCVV